MNHRQYKKMMRPQVSRVAFKLLYHPGYIKYIDESFTDFLDGHYVLEGEIFRKARCYSEFILQREMFEQYMRIAQNFFLGGAIWVSTTFLGFDHAYGDGTPVLFESMCFCYRPEWKEHDIDGMQERYHTYEAAVTGHRKMCETVEAAVKESV